METTRYVCACFCITVMVTENLLRYSGYRKAPPFPLSTRTVTSTMFKSSNYMQDENLSPSLTHTRSCVCACANECIVCVDIKDR